MARRRGSGPEQATVRAILQFLALHKIPAWRMTTGALPVEKRVVRFGVVGMADIIGVLTGRVAGRMSFTEPVVKYAWPGQFLAIEVKSATGRPTAAQLDFLAIINKAGGKAFVARSVSDVARELGL